MCAAAILRNGFLLWWFLSFVLRFVFLLVFAFGFFFYSCFCLEVRIKKWCKKLLCAQYPWIRDIDDVDDLLDSHRDLGNNYPVRHQILIFLFIWNQRVKVIDGVYKMQIKWRANKRARYWVSRLARKKPKKNKI